MQVCTGQPWPASLGLLLFKILASGRRSSVPLLDHFHLDLKSSVGQGGGAAVGLKTEAHIWSFGICQSNGSYFCYVAEAWECLEAFQIRKLCPLIFSSITVLVKQALSISQVSVGGKGNALNQSYPTCGLCTSSSSINRELDRNANSWTLPQTCWIRIFGG